MTQRIRVLQELGEQFERAVESSGTEPKRTRTDALRHRWWLYAAGALAVVIVGVVVFTRAAGGDHGHANRAALPSLQHRSRVSTGPATTLPGTTQTVGRGAFAYCVNSRTGQRTSCSGSPGPGLSGAGALGPFSPGPGQPVALVSQLNLTAPSGASRPDGLARIAKQSGKLGVTILGRGLRANTRRDAYAVWLIDGPGGSHMLGFVNPAVTRAGRLRTIGRLPGDTFRYHQLAVTRETRAHPATPGTVVLTTHLHR